MGDKITKYSELTEGMQVMQWKNGICHEAKVKTVPCMVHNTWYVQLEFLNLETETIDLSLYVGAHADNTRRLETC